MKLFLHWLRWDLRRFRWPLLLWTVLLTAFIAWMGYANSHLLTSHSLLLYQGWTMAAILGVTEVFILLGILSSDPATGAHHFWKTRPPSGFSVASARLAIALFFFLALPLLGWWLVVQVSASRLPHFLNVSLLTGVKLAWMEFLWWMQAFALSALILAAAVTRGAAGTVARILTASAVMVGVMFLLAMVVGGERETASADLSRKITKAIFEGAFTMIAPGIWLLLTTLLFLVARRTRTPSWSIQRVHLVLPLAVLGAGAWLPQPPRKPRPAPPPLSAELAAALHIGEPLPGDGIYEGQYSVMNPEGIYKKVPGYSLQLKLSGLPENHSATAQWKELTLTAPNGHTNTMRYTGSYGGSGPYSERRGVLPVSQFYLSKPEDLAFSLAPCRAEGILSIEVRRKRPFSMPVKAGAVMDAPRFQLMLTDVSPPFLSDGTATWFRFRNVVSDFDHPRPPVSLQNSLHPERRLILPGTQGTRTGVGGFMLYGWSSWSTGPNHETPRLERARFARDAETGRLDSWRLVVSVIENAGQVDVPVKLDQLVIPRLPGDDRKVEDICRQLHIAPGASDAEISRTVKYALSLPNEFSSDPAEQQKQNPVTREIVRLLESVPRERREVLLQIAEECEMERPLSNLYPLRSRIAAMLTAEDIPALQQKPKLFRFLRFALSQRSLIPPVSSPTAEWEDMDGETLLQEWEKSLRRGRFSTNALGFASWRGEPWVPAVVAEIADLMPQSEEATTIGHFMSKVSDCPYEGGMPWLRENAARLKWDPAAKRWILPAP